MTVSSSDGSTSVPNPVSRRRRRLGLGLLAAAGVIASLMSEPGLSGVLGAGLAVIMLAIAVIDGRRFIIPNQLTAAGFALGLVHAAVQQPEAIVPAVTLAIARAAVLALSFFLLCYLYKAVRGREGLGLGDVKLAGVAGAWLDWLMIPIAIELAACAALLVYVLRYIVFNRSLAATQRVPFGLFLAPAIWLGWIGQTIWPALF